MCLLRETPMLRHLQSSLRRARERAVALIRGVRQSRTSHPPVGAAHLLLDRLPQILQQMEAIGNLPRLWCAFPRALRIKATTIAADNLDLRVLAEPHGCRRGRAIRKHVDNFAPFEIHHDRSVVHALEPAPLVDTQHAHFTTGPPATLCFKCLRIVSSLVGRPRRFINRSAGWPPTPCPNNRMISATLSV